MECDWECEQLSEKWATNYQMQERVNTQHYRTLPMCFRPIYLPRNFGQTTVVLVYVSDLHFK